MGRDKTARTILKRFFMPIVFKDETDYCHSCQQSPSQPKKLVKRQQLYPTNNGTAT